MNECCKAAVQAHIRQENTGSGRVRTTITKYCKHCAREIVPTTYDTTTSLSTRPATTNT